MRGASGSSRSCRRYPRLRLERERSRSFELTAAYSAFANKGLVAAPRLISRVEDASGKTIWFAEEHRTQAISATTAYLMSSMLADVVSSGTAARARSAGFTLPSAGKTGSTDDYADAWFIGYTPHLLTGVWFGLDQPAPIMRGGFGGVVAVPAWASFMRAATKGATPEWYRMPTDIEKVAICRLSGSRAGPGCRDAHTMTPASEHLAVGAALTQATDASAVTPAALLPPAEPLVYEDLFPVGAVPSETCSIHDPARAATTTPVVDAVLQASTGPVPPPLGPAIRSPSSRSFVDRVPTADGSHRVIVRQRQY